MKTFLCGCGKTIQVDDIDFEDVMKHSWHCGKGTIVQRSSRINGEKDHISLGRFLLLMAPNLFPDHINRDIHDNRRENLRVATRSQNGANRKVMSNNTSGFRGVIYLPKLEGKKPWRAQPKKDGKY